MEKFLIMYKSLINFWKIQRRSNLRKCKIIKENRKKFLITYESLNNF